MLSNGVPNGVMLTLKLAISRRESAQVTSGVTASASVADDPKAVQPSIDYSSVEAIAKQGESWNALLARLDIMVNLGDQLAEVSDEPHYR